MLRTCFWPSEDEEQRSSCHFCHPSLPHASCCSQASTLRSHNAPIVHQLCQAAPREQLRAKGLGRALIPGGTTWAEKHSRQTYMELRES